MSTPSRKLVAVLAADVVGYSRLIAEDEDLVMAILVLAGRLAQV